MSIYTKHYENPYPDGYQDRPSEETPVTADILNMESQAFEAIEAYLEDNPIPSKTSDLTNDSGFITNLVSNLVNYYNKAAIDNLIASVSGNLNIEVVEALPTTGISTTTFYLVPKADSADQNLYDEYINTNGTTSGWERLGDVSTNVDMSDYYDKDEIDDVVQTLNEAIANKVDKIAGKGLSTNDYTTTEKNKLAGIADNANNYSLPLAGAGTRGGVKIGYSANGKNYPVQLSNEQMYVNVPWTDTNTTYNDATQSTHGLMSVNDKKKLDGIASGAEVNVQADWNATDDNSDAFIKNKPTIPTVNNGILTIQKNGANVQTFSANQSGNATANITVPTKTSELTNDSNFATANSPTFTGTPKAPTPADTDNSTRIATTAYVKSLISSVPDFSSMRAISIEGLTIGMVKNTEIYKATSHCIYRLSGYVNFSNGMGMRTANISVNNKVVSADNKYFPTKTVSNISLNVELELNYSDSVILVVLITGDDNITVTANIAESVMII